MESVHNQDVEVAVVVVVEKRGAVSVGVDDVVFRRCAGDVEKIQTCLGRDIGQLDRGALSIGKRCQKRDKRDKETKNPESHWTAIRLLA